MRSQAGYKYKYWIKSSTLCFASPRLCSANAENLRLYSTMDSPYITLTIHYLQRPSKQALRSKFSVTVKGW